MRVLVVSGIWPPDVGGPASHGPDVAAFLLARGHVVEAVVTADAEPAPEPYPVRWIDRSLPKGYVHARAAVEIAHRARAADVVYSTGMFARTAAACGAVRRPLVVKLTGDPAFERARWRGAVAGDLEQFEAAGGAQVAVLRRLRALTLRRASHVVTPSDFLRGRVVSWGVPAERISVLPNPTPAIPALPPRDELRRVFDLGDEPVLAFAGRFGPQKALDVAIDALDRVDGVTLLLAGDGEEREELERRASALGDRVRFLGPLRRTQVLELFAAADASVLTSSWENLPHSVLESLAVGTPVIATAVGGVPEVVQDGVNGLLVPPGDVDAVAGALRRFFADDALRRELRTHAPASVASYAPSVAYGRLEAILEEARG